MNSKYRFLLVLLAITALFITGCSEDTSAPVEDDSASLTLRNYLIDNDMDLPDSLSNWIIGADVVQGNEANYYILDIRSESGYNTGQIPGAVHSSLATIVTDAAAATNPIVVVCFTGQSAGHAVVALRLSGYSDAKVLKFGMSSWHSDFDSWTTNCLNTASGLTTWIAPTGSITASTEHNYPSLSATATDGAGILAERVAAMLAGGFKGVESTVVLANPSAYFINNYWAAIDVETYGNIQGARRLNPMGLVDGFIKHNDPGASVVTYCWTGQTSSMITAYLTVLGYDAVSLKFGSNNMIYDDLTAHNWTASFDYAYESTPTLQ